MRGVLTDKSSTFLRGIRSRRKDLYDTQLFLQQATGYSGKVLDKFRLRVRAYYRAKGRHTLPWRRTRDPYRIFVSELMLQQTQISRVLPKYRIWIRAFPNWRA